MSTQAWRTASAADRLRIRAKLPLYRNGYALIASSAVTSALGLVYWTVAARLYDARSVGIGAALIAAVTLLANLAHLNLKSALNRFLPTAGADAGRLVLSAYALAVAVATVTGAVFLAGLPVWSPELAWLLDRPALALWFVAATVTWTIFVLQDGALAGLRQALWVPAENTTFAVAKILLLVALSASMPALGVFVSWTAPILVLIVPVNLLLFRRLLPRHERAALPSHAAPPVAAIARYVAPDYAAYLLWAATIGVLPLVVVNLEGAEANAYYYVAWTIAYSLYLISSGMGMSLLAEAAGDPERLRVHARLALAETARLVVPAALVVVAAAPAILHLLGPGYAEHGTTLLRLLALSAVPYAVVATYANAARAQRRMRAVVITYASLALGVVALGVPLLGPLGIDGLGVAWLAAQTAVAGAIAGTELVGDASRARFRRLLSEALAALRNRTRARRSRSAEQAALLELRASRLERWHWRTLRRLRADNDVAVTAVGLPGVEPAAILKRASSDPADAALERHARTLANLHGRKRLTEWLPLIPRLLAGGSAAGHGYTAETALPGVSATRALREGADPEQLLARVVAAIEPLHRATRRRPRVDEPLLADWLDRPLAVVAPLVEARSRVQRPGQALDALAAEIRGELADRTVATGFIHGDLCLANVLVSRDDCAVTGIVDWEQGRPRQPAELDLVHLLITTRMETEAAELGAVVVAMLGEREAAGEAAVLDRAAGLRAPVSRGLVLLAWLQHLANNLVKSDRFARNRTWVRHNVDAVLATVPAAAAVPVHGPQAPLAGAATALRSRLAAVDAGRLAALGAVPAALILWALALPAIEPRRMGDLGLIDVLPAQYYVALLLVGASFATLAVRGTGRPLLLGAHLGALILMLQATPAIVYGTLRYSWAWKHVGVVDYFQRHGTTTPDIEYLSVYHNWPGFFALDTVLVELAGLHDTLGLASWAPVAFAALDVAALLFLFSALTSDRRVVWLACGLFLIANWVGQDYFAPQAFAFFLYLVLLGVVLRFLGPAAAGRERKLALGFATLLLAGIVTSHALTSLMCVLALAALVLTRLCAARSLPFLAAGMTAIWGLLFASRSISDNADAAAWPVRLPWQTAESNLTETEVLSSGQVLVSTTSRALVVVMVALAAIGFLRRRGPASAKRAAAVLALVPGALFAAGAYEGEMVFRIYLFAVPFLAFLAVHALPAAGRGWSGPLVAAVAGVALLGAFLVAYYGKDGRYYFTRDEVAASHYVYSHARPGALLVEGTRNYPGQFENYERLVYVALAREPRSSQRRVLAHPAAVLAEWLGDADRNGGYVLITRSMKAEVRQLGALPRGSLERVERALLRSPRFDVVFHRPDATVFMLRGAPG